MPNDFPWFAYYPRDFRDGTTRMTLMQKGAYISLINEQWISGPLPDDPEILARILQTDLASFTHDIWPALKSHFVHDDDGNLVNPRVEEERRRSLDKSQKRRDAAGKRWEKAGRADDIKQPQQHHACTTHAIASANDDAIAVTRARYNHNHSYTSSLRSDDTPACPDPDLPKSVTPLPPDARRELFNSGLERVARITGKPRQRCRPLLGKWLKACRDDAAVLTRIIADACEHRPAEPVAWIEGAIRHREPRIIAQAADQFGFADVDLDAPLRIYEERLQSCLH